MAQTDSYLQTNLKARHLRLLVALEEMGNLKRVAEVTHVTVPAVSKALAELEKGLGFELFERTAQGLRPTLQGECMVRHARTMLASINLARDELRALDTGAEGRVRIGVLPVSASVLLPHALALMKSRTPGNSVLVVEGSSDTLLPQLWQGSIDLIVGRLPLRHGVDGLAELELLHEPVVLVTRRDHPLAKKRRLRWTDLRPYPWVLPPVGSLLRAPLEQVLERHGVMPPANIVETLSSHVARSYLALTDAVGAMAGVTVPDPTQTLHALPLALPPLLRPAGVLWNRNRDLTPAARQMIECLEEVAAGMA